MRILVLQLARFGDIYQTWPTLNALKRRYPGAELHVMVRERFREAMDEFDGVQLHVLPNKDIFRPLFENGNELEALKKLKAFLEPLEALRFELIVNLSFSPFSSYVTDFLAGPGAEVHGYTRHSDGYLAIPDDSSAYFYAQVGVGRANRFHLTEVFAGVAGVELELDDFRAAPRALAKRNRIAVHTGASSSDKVYPAELWVEVLNRILLSYDGEIVLIGSSNERKLNEAIRDQIQNDRLTNLCGQTSLKNLFTVVEDARLLIGGDSCPIHMAGLKGTPVLNLSCAAVNFWETGPASIGSRVLYARRPSDLEPKRIADEALAMLEGRSPQGPCWLKTAAREAYITHGLQDDDFNWKLIGALYTGADFPKASSEEDGFAFRRLYELAELTLSEMAGACDPATLGQIDQMLERLPKLNARVEPVIQWFQTERIRIPPGAREELLTRTRKVFEDLLWVSAVYCQSKTHSEKLAEAGRLCRGCGVELREWNFGAIENDFQALTTALGDLADATPKVGDESWPSVLGRINSALARHDFLELADILEWDLAPAFERQLKQEETSGQDMLS